MCLIVICIIKRDIVKQGKDPPKYLLLTLEGDKVKTMSPFLNVINNHNHQKKNMFYPT